MTVVTGILCRRVAAKKIWVDCFQGFRCATPLAYMGRRVAAKTVSLRQTQLLRFRDKTTQHLHVAAKHIARNVAKAGLKFGLPDEPLAGEA
jgi:hypothetical protein